MNPETLQKLVDAYIERYTKQYQWDKDLVLREQDLNFWAWEEFERLLDKSPDRAWEVILSILGATTDEYTLDCLAAGQLEDLIHQHGEAFIERIEEQAKRDQRFRDLLWGVWESSTPDVWARVIQAREPQGNSGA